MDDSVREMMVVIVEQLKAYVEGDEDALLELSELLDSGRYDAQLVGQAFEMIFRALEPYGREDFGSESSQERPSLRVPSGQERALLSSNPAYGYLFALLEKGEVTPEQFEEIMNRAREMGSSLHDEDQARELATDVLIRWFDDENGVLFDPANSAGVH
ncbi:MAG TPA: hypothetical protein VFP58_01055 [Candidatus Eisenbacteria bacterium]|nr:hypothetical protein [Candidatus Eisenbacteria bacterium]